MQTAAALASQLPPKEASSLRKLFKFYETKQYKKGIKEANKILEKFPDHPETNSLKGLFVYLTDDQDAGFKLAKAALAKNFKSELCWHILGIINRNQKKYTEAIGCYKQALKYDPNNVNILRDLAVLQVHVRELDLHQDTRRILLQGKSNLPLNWIGLAVSEYLLGNHEQTLKVLESFRNVVKEDELKGYEKSELILFEVTVMLDMGHYKEALKYLSKHDKSILDRTAFNEYAIKAYLALGHADKAEDCIRFLLDKYPENLKMVQIYREIRGLGENTSENRQKIADLHTELLQKYPKSTAIQRNQLKFLEGEEFRQKFDEYLRPFFIKGLPSFFSDIRELLNDTHKAKIIEEVVLQHYKSLEEKGTFHCSEIEENPCCLLWGYMFLSSFYNWKGDYTKAIDYVEKAILHTPTLVELYTLKAKIFKTCYNYKLAAEVADKARNMDLADRYPNNLTVKYKIRAGEIAVGDAMLKMFIRDSSDANIHELQYMWYEYELGNAYLKKHEWGPGLRQFKFIEKHFQDFYEDQFDFHTYCLRKYALRSYVNMIRNADDVSNNKNYIKATLSMIKGLEAYEKALPEIQKKEEEEKKAVEEMDAQERKRYKKGKEAKEAKETDPNSEKLDLRGKKLLEEIKTPIDEAVKFANRLLPCKVESLKYRVKLFPELCALYLRKGKPLQAIKAYNKVADLVNENASVHLARLRLIEGLEKAVTVEGLDAEIKAVIEEELAHIKAGSDAKGLHAAFKSSSHKSLTNEITTLECEVLLGLISQQDAAHAVFETVKRHHETARINEVVFALEKLKETFGGHEETEKKIKELFKERFSLSPIFNEEALNLKAINPLPIPSLVE